MQINALIVAKIFDKDHFRDDKTESYFGFNIYETIHGRAKENKCIKGTLKDSGDGGAYLKGCAFFTR